MSKSNDQGKSASNITSFYQECIEEIFQERRGVFINYIYSRLSKLLQQPAEEISHEELSGSWVEIDSLSRLRGLVGGRFQNLKSKWLAAGFPIKQEKGAGKSFRLDEKGWIELSSWISNQGYEVRLNPEKSEAMFEIRQLI